MADGLVPTQPAVELDWDTMDRLLQDLCDGHPGYSSALYRLQDANGVGEWLCKNCFVPRWIAAGRPPLRRLDGSVR